MTMKINSMVNDIMEELMDLDMEPKPWSWWTSTYETQVGATLELGRKSKSWEMPFVEVFDLLVYRFLCNGQDSQGAERIRALKKKGGQLVEGFTHLSWQKVCR